MRRHAHHNANIKNKHNKKLNIKAIIDARTNTDTYNNTRTFFKDIHEQKKKKKCQKIKVRFEEGDGKERERDRYIDR